MWAPRATARLLAVHQLARVALNSVPLYGGGDVPFAFSPADSADADVSIYPKHGGGSICS